MKPRLLHGSATLIEGYIEPRQRTAINGVKDSYVFGQRDTIEVYAYGLKNNDNGVCAVSRNLETDYTYIVVMGGWERFYDNLLQGEHGRGGLVYELDHASFKKVTSSSGGEEWISRKPARIIGSTEVTVNDAMGRGVQIFGVGPLVSQALQALELADPHMDPVNIIWDGYNQGSVEWLNRQRNNNPITPPESARREAFYRLGLHANIYSLS